MATERRLIDANFVYELHSNYPAFARSYADLTDLRDILDEAPTVDAVEVVHGHWEWYTDRCEDLFLGCDDDYGWRCSKCKVPLDDEDDPEVMPTFRYCPNCGAKMDGDGDD